jgi:hypothetical protein
MYHKENDLRRCEVCLKEVKVPIRDLSLIYIADEEFRLCAVCKKEFVNCARQLFDGLRMQAGNPPRIYRDSNLETQMRGAKKTAIGTVRSDEDTQEYKRTFGR